MMRWLSSGATATGTAGGKRVEKTLEKTPEGRIGLWSKADSRMFFETFEVTKL